MSPFLNPSLPLQKTADITRYLRSRDIPLPALLPFAEAVLDPKESNIYFPRKEEWLLEWLVQRLGEKGAGTTEARCDAAFWRLLLRLLMASSQVATGVVLKKHNLLQVVGKTLSEVTVAGEGCGGEDTDADTDQEVYSTPKETHSLDSSSTEIELPEMGARRPTKVGSLLESVCCVLLYLQENKPNGRKGSNIVAALRGTPEFGAQILGSYFEACLTLLRAGGAPQEGWTQTVVNVWRSCIWGNPDSKKISSLFSASCLPPATQLLSTPFTPSSVRNTLEGLLSEFIFSPAVLFPRTTGKVSKASPKELKIYLDPLKSQTEGLPQLFEIAISSQSKNRKLDSETVEAIFDAISTFGDAEKPPSTVTALLEILVGTGTSLSSETLARIVDVTSNLPGGKDRNVRWDVVELALKLDFDIFLGADNQERRGRLTEAFNNIGPGEDEKAQVLNTIEILIDGYVKARDLGEFITIWMNELRSSHSMLWKDDALAKMVADRLEKALSGGQIERLFKAAVELGDETDWVVADALLRGVRTEETEDRLKNILPEVVESIKTHGRGWRRWRLLLRVLHVDRAAVDHTLLGQNYPGSGVGNGPKEVLFSGELSMALSDVGNTGDSAVDSITSVVMAMGKAKGGWDGSVASINLENLWLALVMGLISGWLRSIERIPRVETKQEFVDSFLETALTCGGEGSTITGKVLWRKMLASEEFYECPTLKDAVLAALIRRLKLYIGPAVDIEAALADTSGGSGKPLGGQQIKDCDFVLGSVLCYPLEAIKRATREKFLDALVLLDTKPWSSCPPQQQHTELRNKIKAVVERLWTVGNASSFLAKSADALLQWALSGGGEAARLVLRHAFSTKEQQHSRGFLSDLVKMTEKSVAAGYDENTTLVNLLIVEEFWKAGEQHAVRSLRQCVMDNAATVIGTGKVNAISTSIWHRAWVLDRGGEGTRDAMKLAQVIIQGIKGLLPSILSTTLTPYKTMEGAARAAKEVALLLCACCETEDEAVSTAALVIGILSSPYAEELRSDMVAAYTRMAERLQYNVFEQCLVAVVDGYLLAASESSSDRKGYWPVLRALVGSARKPSEEVAKRTTDRLSTVFSKLARNLYKMRTVEDFVIAGDCMDTILREKPWAVMQYNIDETLTAITIACSPSGPTFTVPNPDSIFLLLCNLTRTILTLHRLRIRGGRYHLVVAALQSLLHCTFKRKPASHRKKSDKIIHPPWLLPTHHNSPLPPKLSQESLTHGFTRLLTTFCEPSVSSVRSRHNTSLLDSEREREKREVAACVGPLLGEVLKGGLSGGLEGDIQVGIGAIFEVLGAEGVKAFARSVDKEGRAMLRQMWDEYRRLGGSGDKW